MSTPSAHPPYRDLVGLTFWVGFVIALAGAEAWIRRTRQPASRLVAVTA